MNPVLVFRTSVTSEAEISHLKPLLDRFFCKGEDWNFDLEDWENILRVANARCDAQSIIGLLQAKGYHCEELEN